MSAVKSAGSNGSVSDVPAVPLPRPADTGELSGCRIQLSESPEGWLLRVSLTVEAAAALTGAGYNVPHRLRPGDVSISIRPNLVPCEPFDVSLLHIRLSNARPPES